MKVGVVGLGWFVGFLMGFSVATVRITENITAFVDSTVVSEVEGSVIEPIDDERTSKSELVATDAQPDSASDALDDQESAAADEPQGETAESQETEPLMARGSASQEDAVGASAAMTEETIVAAEAVAAPSEDVVSVAKAPAEPLTTQETGATTETAISEEKVQEASDLAWTREPDSLIEAGTSSDDETVIEVAPDESETEWSVDTSSMDDGFQTVGFDFLAGFNYEVSDDFLLVEDGQASDKGPEIPERVLALNQNPVAVTGFMMPLKVVEDDKVSEFLLLRSAAMCCYGQVPEVNEWISVTMTGKPTTSVMDRPVQVRGTLRVGEMREDGYLVGIYEMDGESLEVVAHEVD